MADGPGLPVAIDVAVAQQRLDDTMPGRRAGATQIITRSDEIPKALLRGRRRRHERELPGAIEPHELLRVTPVGLDPVARPDRHQRRRNHVARHADRAEQPVELVSTRACLIRNRQAIPATETLDEATDRSLSVLQAHHFGLATTRGQRCGHERQLVLVDRDPGAHLDGRGRANVWHGWSSFVCGTGRDGR